MIRLLRTVLAAEGMLMSWRTFRHTQRLQRLREHGDQSLKGAIALTPQSRIFNVPNGLVASMYFAFVAFLSATGFIDKPVVRRLSLFLVWGSLAMSGYFVYQLWFVLRKNCPLCLRTHTLNLALTLAVTAQAVRQEQMDR